MSYDKPYFKSSIEPDDTNELKQLIWPVCAGSMFRIAKNMALTIGEPISIPKMREVYRTCRRINPTSNYWVSEDGDVYRLTIGQWSKYARMPPHKLKTTVTRFGYRIVGLSDRPVGCEPTEFETYYGRPARNTRVDFGVHVLVAYTWISPAPFPGALVRHLDGIESHNHHTNLAWGSYQDNADDRKWHAEFGKGRPQSIRPSERLLVRLRSVSDPQELAPLCSAGLSGSP